MSINMIIVYAYKQHLFYWILVQVLMHRIVFTKYGNQKTKAVRILLSIILKGTLKFSNLFLMKSKKIKTKPINLKYSVRFFFRFVQ